MPSGETEKRQEQNEGVQRQEVQQGAEHGASLARSGRKPIGRGRGGNYPPEASNYICLLQTSFRTNERKIPTKATTQEPTATASTLSFIVVMLRKLCCAMNCVLQRSDLAAVIPMTLPAICFNFLFLLARLASASAAACAPLNHWPAISQTSSTNELKKADTRVQVE